MFALVFIALYNSRLPLESNFVYTLPRRKRSTVARRDHLEALRQLVGNVYPNKFERSEVVQPGREDTIPQSSISFARSSQRQATMAA